MMEKGEGGLRRAGSDHIGSNNNNNINNSSNSNNKNNNDSSSSSSNNNNNYENKDHSVENGKKKDRPAHPSSSSSSGTKKPAAKRRTKQGLRWLGLTSWILSLALAFSLVQTFTYQPPSHLDTMSMDHHNPTKLFIQQIKEQQQQQQQQQQQDSPRLIQQIINLPLSQRRQRPKAEGLLTQQHHQRRRTLTDVLREAHVFDSLSQEELGSLPALDQAYRDLYGPLTGVTANTTTTSDEEEGPVMYGLEMCEEYRRLVPNVKERYTGPAGMFNTGTNNVDLTLKRNLKGAFMEVHYRGTAHYQVPWGKHRMESRRLNHTAPEADHLDQTKCLPIVIIRDPYHWMQSMCKTSYAAKWKHGKNRCPNLIAHGDDWQRFEHVQWDKDMLKDPKNGQHGSETFQVKVLFDDDDKKYFDSLVDLWNLWYRPYWENKNHYPRLMIRHEDMLLHAPTIVKKISECMGVGLKGPFQYQTETAKEHGSGATFLTAIMKSADPTKRQAMLTDKDKKYAASHLDPELMQAFQYRAVKD